MVSNLVLQRYAQMAGQARVPWRVHVEVTRRCNERCRHCYLPEYVDRRPLSVEEFDDLFGQLYEAGTFYLTFTGGEATLHPQFREIAAAARRRPFALAMITNATFIDESLADFIAGLNMAKVAVSVYGAEARTHDALTTLPGSFERTWRGIRLLAARGVPVSLNIATTSENFREIPRLRTMAEEIGAAYIQGNTITARSNGAEDTLALRLSGDDYRREMSEAFRLHPHAERGCVQESLDGNMCTAGVVFAHVNANGEVSPCPDLPVPGGNLRQRRFADIWNNSWIFRTLRETTMADVDGCNTCSSLSHCYRCPGMALVEDGNLFGPAAHACLETDITTGALAPTPAQGDMVALPALR